VGWDGCMDGGWLHCVGRMDLHDCGVLPVGLDTVFLLGTRLHEMEAGFEIRAPTMKLYGMDEVDLLCGFN
jgi:hypothetical protein